MLATPITSPTYQATVNSRSSAEKFPSSGSIGGGPLTTAFSCSKMVFQRPYGKEPRQSSNWTIKEKLLQILIKYIKLAGEWNIIVGGACRTWSAATSFLIPKLWYATWKVTPRALTCTPNQFPWNVATGLSCTWAPSTCAHPVITDTYQRASTDTTVVSSRPSIFCEWLNYRMRD